MSTSKAANHEYGGITRWYDLVRRVAPNHNLPPELVLAVIAQESSGDPCAVRVERGFWQRYQTNIEAIIKATPSRLDDPWIKFPDFASSSYGLMQVMYIVAIERGISLRFPTSLCDPEVGVTAGCRQLQWLMRQVGNDKTRALLRYNGGGDKGYPAKIFGWQEKLAPFI